jgi:hypothetical protein
MNTNGPSHVHLLLLVALLLAAVAYWAPWVGHPAAALKLTGQDLGEFVKFIPETGPTFPRQLFYVPPLACTLFLVLLAVQPSAHLPRWLRTVMLACALLILPGLLPPVWGHPGDLFKPEFRLQGLAMVLGLAVIAAHGLLGRVPKRVTGFALLCLALLALVLPQAAFWAIRGPLWAVYNTPTIRLGWGLWLHVLAWIGVLAATWQSFLPGPAPQE